MQVLLLHQDKGIQGRKMKSSKRVKKNKIKNKSKGRTCIWVYGTIYEWLKTQIYWNRAS